jgi:hypothetical protein
MVVVGTACLDQYGLRCCHEVAMQAKGNGIICDTILKHIVKSLLYQFQVHTGIDPKRALVYRSGGHDGLFDSELYMIGNVMQMELHHVPHVC